MLGFGHIGQHAIGFIVSDASTPLVYKPVSRIVAGGWSNGRPVEVAVLGVDLIDDEDPENYIVNDADEIIGTEA